MNAQPKFLHGSYRGPSKALTGKTALLRKLENGLYSAQFDGNVSITEDGEEVNLSQGWHLFAAECFKLLESPEDLRKRALALYTPPFRFEHGYIFDSQNHMVADTPLKTGLELVRIRGWGRISYLENPEALQDTVGAMVAEALNQFWSSQQ